MKIFDEDKDKLAMARFKVRYPNGSQKSCKNCCESKNIDEFRLRRRDKANSISYILSNICKACSIIRLKGQIKCKNIPDWALSEELFDSIIYYNFLVKCLKKPKKTCPKCKNIGHRFYDFYSRRRGNYYLAGDICKSCYSVKSKQRRDNNIDQYRATERKRNNRISEAITSSYVKKQIKRKERQQRYKDNPELLPDFQEQRISLIRFRINRMGK